MILKSLGDMYLWPFSKSKFKSDRVNLVAPAGTIECLLYLPNVWAIQYKLYMYCMYVYVLYMLLVVPFSLDYPMQRWPSLLLIPCSVFTYSRRRHHNDNTLRNFKFSFYKISLSPGIKFTLAESSHKIWRMILLRWIWYRCSNKFC